MSLDKLEETLKNNRFEPVKCYWEDSIRVVSLTIAAGGLSEGARIVFMESKPNNPPAMEFETFDSESVKVEPEASEAIAYCIGNFNAVWNFFYDKSNGE